MNPSKPVPTLLLWLPVLLGLALALLFWRGLTFDPNRTASRLIGKPVPAFSLPALQDGGRLLDSADIKGPALINVWATWCTACRNEHPLLLEITRQYGVNIYGVDYQDEAESAKAWLQQQGDPFVWVMFDGAASAGLALDVFSLPQTYAIDAEGIIRYRHIGELNEPVWRAMWALISAHQPVTGS
ncbi:DsbE family thiol:disulfide interchange protein [Methylomonas rhizoryzae]|uniref:DsbE family thiol:disulfide interchange protein n=1 Tax=Methylomonas rhizoryzae TaxID=2608981 RepID=UPI001231FBC3|nr:DsbE family thiol:disulfide interchange protein [Methylomonas rhizoryzae]